MFYCYICSEINEHEEEIEAHADYIKDMETVEESKHIQGILSYMKYEREV